MPYILNAANKPVHVALGSPEMMNAANCYQTEAEAKAAQRDACQHETMIGNRSTGHVQCADCGAPPVKAATITRQALESLWRELQHTAIQNPEDPPYVRLANALALLPMFPAGLVPPFSKGETDLTPNDSGIFTAGIDVGMWFNMIEVYGHSAAEAEAVRDYVLSALAGHVQPMIWLPMSQAPKNKNLLLRRPDGDNGIGRYEENRYAKKPRPYWDDLRRYKGVQWMREKEPIGWMEIPE